uniref:Anther-specific proline-rich protein APG-like isoform X2 n=1 Tax=Nicotiana tabacum TaxID=4097 RepID=A0A1S3YBA4_TOBAC|nr:anther-specific proline-rich protein APG-like isoform X2 [Nicotiana tomentosiformis]XP_016449490.1 PREDICTED: anther-specific proline-rich protein APG-like isoform X2 [Nicotiana tabacum]
MAIAGEEEKLKMVSGYASPSSSPPTPQSPLPVSVGPAHFPYYFSSSPSPSPPFSPPPSPHTDILHPTSPAPPFSVDRQLQPHHELHSTCSCLLDFQKRVEDNDYMREKAKPDGTCRSQCSNGFIGTMILSKASGLGIREERGTRNV